MLDSFAPVELRRVIFRGKNLGTALTAVQKAAIKDGSFKGMFLGDYWSIGGRIWRIVDMDYWYNCGDTAFTSHHLVIMPDEALYNAQMNTTNITTGGYVGSEMYKRTWRTQRQSSMRLSRVLFLLTENTCAMRLQTEDRPVEHGLIPVLSSRTNL